MATAYKSIAPHDRSVCRHSKDSLKTCMQKPTAGCRIKNFMGLGVGVFSRLSEQVILEMINDMMRSDYNQTSTVSSYYDANKSDDGTAPILFQTTITGGATTAGSDENRAMLAKFKKLEEKQERLLLLSNPNKNLAQLKNYIGLVVGKWGGKDEEYLYKFVKFMEEREKFGGQLYGEEAARDLATIFADGKQPSQTDEDLAWRLADESIHVGVFFFSSFASGFAKTMLSKTTAGVADQHLAAIRKAIDLLEFPDEYQNAVGKTYGRFSDLVDVDHEAKNRRIEELRAAKRARQQAPDVQ